MAISVGAPRSGYSLMEIMFVIAIMGVLAAIAGPYLVGMLSGAKVKTTKQSLLNIKRIVELFNAEQGDYPDSLKDLYKKPTNEDLAKNWTEPYVEEKALVDAWNQKFQYKKTPDQEQGHPYELYSYGPKGKSSKSERIDVWKL